MRWLRASGRNLAASMTLAAPPMLVTASPSSRSDEQLAQRLAERRVCEAEHNALRVPHSSRVNACPNDPEPPVTPVIWAWGSGWIFSNGRAHRDHRLKSGRF